VSCDGIRRDAERRVAELRARLIEWDVLGVYADDDGPGDENEYDDLIAPIMRWLGAGDDAPLLSARIVTLLRDDYGLDIPHKDAASPFASSLVRWWREANSNMDTAPSMSPAAGPRRRGDPVNS